MYTFSTEIQRTRPIFHYTDLIISGLIPTGSITSGAVS